MLQNLINIVKSPAFADFLVRWWPAIESRLTARGLGRIAQRLTFLYKNVKPGETEFTGLVDEHIQHDRPELAMGDKELPALSTVWAKVEKEVKAKLTPTHQKSIGFCVLWTMQNLMRLNLYQHRAEVQPLADTAYMGKKYRYTKQAGDDLGCIVDDVINNIKYKGFPIQTFNPAFTKEELLALDMNPTVDIAGAYALHLIDHKRKIIRGNTLDQLISDLDGLDPKTVGVQISLDIYRHKTASKSYWFNWIITAVADMYKTGRHSVTMLFANIQGTQVGVMQGPTERGFLVMDSGDGLIKFVGESYLKKADWNYRIIPMLAPQELLQKRVDELEVMLGKKPANVFSVPKEEVKKVIAPKPVITGDPLESVVMRDGDKSEEVRLLQTFLYNQGLTGKSAVNAKYGNTTTKAVAAWMAKEAGVAIKGDMWGSSCHTAYKKFKTKK